MAPASVRAPRVETGALETEVSSLCHSGWPPTHTVLKNKYIPPEQVGNVQPWGCVRSKRSFGLTLPRQLQAGLKNQ